MSQFTESACKAFNASAAISQYARVTVSSGNVAAAGELAAWIGTATRATFASGDDVAVRLRTAQGTHKMIASGAISQEAVVYGAADGKISATPNGNVVGIALEAASGNNSVIEVLVMDVYEELMADDAVLAFGTSADVQMLFSDADDDNHTFVLALGNDNQTMHITDVGAKATDWAVAAATHPTVYIHSNTTPASNYLTLGGYDGTIGYLTSTGNLAIRPGLTAGDYVSLQAYDVDGTAWKDMVKCETHATIAQVTICPSATEKLGFFGATPVAQQAHIADATDTSATDQSGPINSILAALEAFGLLATS